MSKFVDKDTSYKEKVVYAKEASKTVATIYGGYKEETGAFEYISLMVVLITEYLFLINKIGVY